MFGIFYTLAVHVYRLILVLLSPFHAKALAMVRGRMAIPEDTQACAGGPTLWFHCASVGEFEQAYPLIELLGNAYPVYKIHVTVYSPSGYGYIRRKYPNQSVSYLPFDTPSGIDYLIRRLKPRLVLIVKYEYWYNFLKRLHRHEVPVVMVSAILRPGHFLLAPCGRPFRPLLQRMANFFVQDETSKQLLAQIGVNRAEVCGDTRFDRVAALAEVPLNDPLLESFAAAGPLFIAGSVWESDLPLLKQVLSALPADWKILIAPHEPTHFDADLLKEPAGRYTAGELPPGRILLLDTVGKLSKAYRLGSLCYVGGGFGKGLHNILEPAVYGVPLMIGAHFEKFREARELVEGAWVKCFQAGEDPGAWVQEICGSPEKRTAISAGLRDYVGSRTNVSEKIAVFLKKNGLL
jgi:3-deoxy-D-manno-octulosonic-acid transferase